MALTRHSGPGTRNLELGTQDQGPGTPDSGPGTRDPGLRQVRPRAVSPARVGYRLWTALVRAATYAVLALLSAVFLLPFLWMVFASLKTDATIHQYPPDLLPREEVFRSLDGHRVREAIYRPALGARAVPVLVVDERPGVYEIRLEAPEAGGRSLVVPRRTVRIRRILRPHWENYPEAWTAKPFARYTLNTVIITLACIFGQVLSASLVAFGFARLRFPGRVPLFFLVLSTMMLPSQVTMMPHYLIYRSLGWIDTFLPLIVPSFLGGGAFFIFLFRQFFMTLPRELDESARLDGASSLRVYWNILMPLCRPIVATVAVFSFIAHWNEFMAPLIYLNSPENMTLALGLRVFQGAYQTYLHLLMAAATVALIPVIFIFFTAQKQFVRSIVLSGLKG
jgi:multiple sugar transport system permease protein